MRLLVALAPFLLKRSIVGSYHQLSAKHLPAYLDEISFKYNNRDNPYLFRDRVMALIGAEAMPYQELIREKVSESTMYRRWRGKAQQSGSAG